MFLLQTLEDVFLKLCRRQEEEKVVEFGESLNIVSQEVKHVDYIAVMHRRRKILKVGGT